MSPRILAHRGASTYALENTVRAVHAAAEHGATDVEVDVQTLADGTLVAHHDPFVATGPDHEVRLADLDLAGFTAALGAAGTTAARIVDVLTTCAEYDLGAYLDLKHVPADLMVDLEDQVRDSGVSLAVLGSMRHDLLVAAREQTTLPTSVMYLDPAQDPVALARSLGCEFVHPCFDVVPDPFATLTPAWHDRVREAELLVVSWNTVDPTTITALARLGVWAICSDDPALVRATLAGSDRGADPEG